LFWSKVECPISKIRRKKEDSATKSAASFYFCCSPLAVRNISGETTIAVVDDDRKLCQKDFAPDQKVYRLFA